MFQKLLQYGSKDRTKDPCRSSYKETTSQRKQSNSLIPYKAGTCGNCSIWKRALKTWLEEERSSTASILVENVAPTLQQGQVFSIRLNDLQESEWGNTADPSLQKSPLSLKWLPFWQDHLWLLQHSSHHCKELVIQSVISCKVFPYHFGISQ